MKRLTLLPPLSIVLITVTTAVTALAAICFWPLAFVLGLWVASYFAAQHPDSWLAKVAAFLAVISGLIVGVTAVAFVLQRFGTLSFENQAILAILFLYAGFFALCEAIARDQRRKHWKMGEMMAHGWVKRFKEITPDTDNNILQALYEDGVALRDEYGPYTHPDFKEHLSEIHRMRVAEWAARLILKNKDTKPAILKDLYSEGVRLRDEVGAPENKKLNEMLEVLTGIICNSTQPQPK